MLHSPYDMMSEMRGVAGYGCHRRKAGSGGGIGEKTP